MVDGITVRLDKTDIQQLVDNNEPTATMPPRDGLPSLEHRRSQGEFTGSSQGDHSRPLSPVWLVSEEHRQTLLPFYISIVSCLGILMAAAAASRSMSSISAGLSSGASSREVSAREVKLGHAQEGSRAWKK